MILLASLRSDKWTAWPEHVDEFIGPGSLLLVAALHGSEIWLVYLMMSMGINQNNFDNYWGYGMVMVLVAFLVVIITGPQNLSRKHTRIVYQEMSG
jgi:hypothetical protein